MTTLIERITEVIDANNFNQMKKLLSQLKADGHLEQSTKISGAGFRKPDAIELLDDVHAELSLSSQVADALIEKIEQVASDYANETASQNDDGLSESDMGSQSDGRAVGVVVNQDNNQAHKVAPIGDDVQAKTKVTSISETIRTASPFRGVALATWITLETTGSFAKAAKFATKTEHKRGFGSVTPIRQTKSSVAA